MRLDQLDAAERIVLEHAAVEGEVFHRGAVHALTPKEPRLTTRLAALVRKELVRPDRAQLPGEDAYRFRHLLIRDAAYRALPKAARARLHEELAAWLERTAADLTELDELLGYHLEQAHRYLAELASDEGAMRALGARARRHLETAGRRAYDRGDVAAATALLEHAWALARGGAGARKTGLTLADALFDSGRPNEAVELAREISALAAGEDDRVGELHARLDAARYAMSTDPSVTADDVFTLADEAAPVLEASGDHAALASAALALLIAYIQRLRLEATAVAARGVVDHSRALGDRRLELVGQGWLAMALQGGPMPAEEVLRAYDEEPWLDEIVPFRRTFRAICLAYVGLLDEARELADDDRRRMEELGATTNVAATSQGRREIAVLAGDLALAEREIRAGCERLEAMGESSFLSTFAAELALILCSLGRWDEAVQWVEKSRSLGADDDLATQALWRQAAARLAANRGRFEEAVRLGRDAVSLLEGTDGLCYAADAHASLAEVLRLAGRAGDAADEAETALAFYERKGIVVPAARMRELVAALRGS
jgi:tetratricopeptide (TPR) repeat protein